MGLRWLK